MYFSLSDAAKKVGMSRSSIYRLIEEGKLSATTDHRGKKVVELTELLRVFGSIQDGKEQEKSQEDKKHRPVNVSGTTGKTGQDTLVSAVQELEKMRYQLQIKEMELKLKNKELELVQERLDDLKQTSEQVNEEKQKLLTIIERQTLLLAAPKPTRAAPATKTAPTRTPEKVAIKTPSKAVTAPTKTAAKVVPKKKPEADKKTSKKGSKK